MTPIIDVADWDISFLVFAVPTQGLCRPPVKHIDASNAFNLLRNNYVIFPNQMVNINIAGTIQITFRL